MASRQIAVIGGGASGFAAAIAAEKMGACVTVLERLPRVGKKLLLTGNGRCNLGHQDAALQSYHGSLPQAAGILQAFDTRAFFAKLGLRTRVDAEGRLYPYSNTAASVLDALRLGARQLGVTECCGETVTDLRQTGHGWKIVCGDVSHRADAVIVAAGGAAAPSCGTDGSMYPILQAMGHSIVPPKPALCPIPTDPKRVRALKGLRVRAAVTALVDGVKRQTTCGEVQFTEGALSGICIFDVSRLAAQFGSRMTLSLNLLPDGETDVWLSNVLQQRAAACCEDLLTGLLPKRVGYSLLQAMQMRPDAQVSECFVDPARVQALTRLLTDWQFPVTGHADFAHAQVTAGGVAGDAVRADLSSACVPNLYCCGEILDVDGDCGGYNLDWAWASGDCAGRAAASRTTDN